MEILDLHSVGSESYPNGVQRLDYAAADGLHDWALLRPGTCRDFWIIMIHGHGSSGDQLFTRPDIRQHWLPDFLATNAGILCPNLRGNAWMSPAAAADMHELIDFLRAEYGLHRTLFCSGSMGGTSNLIYGVLYPGDVNGIVARGAATDLASFHAWCRTRPRPIAREIATAIESAYGGTPDHLPDVYTRHSTQKNTDRLNMPVALSHGAADETIPVSQSRELAQILAGKSDFFYEEIPGGGHDAPLWEKQGFQQVLQRIL